MNMSASSESPFYKRYIDKKHDVAILRCLKCSNLHCAVLINEDRTEYYAGCFSAGGGSQFAPALYHALRKMVEAVPCPYQEVE